VGGIDDIRRAELQLGQDLVQDLAFDYGYSAAGPQGLGQAEDHKLGRTRSGRGVLLVLEGQKGDGQGPGGPVVLRGCWPGIFPVSPHQFVHQRIDTLLLLAVLGELLAPFCLAQQGGGGWSSGATWRAWR